MAAFRHLENMERMEILSVVVYNWVFLVAYS